MSSLNLAFNLSIAGIDPTIATESMPNSSSGLSAWVTSSNNQERLSYWSTSVKRIRTVKSRLLAYATEYEAGSLDYQLSLEPYEDIVLNGSLDLDVTTENTDESLTGSLMVNAVKSSIFDAHVGSATEIYEIASAEDQGDNGTYPIYAYTFAIDK
jgi:hypothetical protein